MYNMNTERTCETCENKDICRYVKEVCDKMKRIEAIADDGMLIVDMRCKRWRNGVHEKEVAERIAENKELEKKLNACDNGLLPKIPESSYPLGEKVRELHFCGPFLCGEVDKPKTPSRENHCF